MLLPAVLVVAVGSSALAADVFNACSKWDATSRLRPSSIEVNASPVCKPTEVPRTWYQGALAYAHVNADGTVDQDSGNITVVKVGALFPGEYCIGVVGGTAHVAVASLEPRGGSDGTVQVGVFWASGCPANANSILARTGPNPAYGDTEDRAFYIIVN
jgi:hypothetical protein